MEAHRSFEAEVGLTVTDSLEVRIGTRLEGDFLVEARAAANRSRSAPLTGEGLAEETRGCIIAVLAAHAAIEAFVNQEGADRDPQWWAKFARASVLEKWRHLASKLGAETKPTSAWLNGVSDLSRDRNLLAHYKGVPAAGGLQFSGAPANTPTRANISPTRAYFSRTRAEASVEAAVEAIRTFHRALKAPVPEFFEPWVREGSVW